MLSEKKGNYLALSTFVKYDISDIIGYKMLKKQQFCELCLVQNM